MAKCNSCSAPLRANTNTCVYCGTRNDVDLNSKYDYSIIRKVSGRLCPHCHKPLQVIDLDLNGSFQIERCKECFGLFFDPGKIETLLECAVSNVSDSNWRHLDAINSDRYQVDEKVKYIKCPVCQAFMSRVNFGYRSGVVIDRCTPHGIWLDSGEITHLMEWKKAGGQLMQDQQTAFENRQEKNNPGTVHDYNHLLTGAVDNGLEPRMLNLVLSVIARFFR